ncbi:AAA family ATPase [Chitinophaga sancti]|uniref:AAA family ATPase n=1 Tax=Chitinophaga sancti TaxID=1004 RepID=UPI003F78BA79
MEKISIQNFAGIKEMDFEFKSINILIGPQGSGKSVTVKLHYFFVSFFQELVGNLLLGGTKKDLDSNQKDKFYQFFPRNTWPEGQFRIDYYFNEFHLYVERLDNQIKFDYSDKLKKAIAKIRKQHLDFLKLEDLASLNPLKRRQQSRRNIRHLVSNEIGDELDIIQYFIPAGRSFFANISANIFTIISDNKQSFDPFLIGFGADYEQLKKWYKDGLIENEDIAVDKLISEILNGDYIVEKDEDYLVHADKRKIPLSKASSGQQETLPLVVLLRVLSYNIDAVERTIIYIEEPEAHLFPDAQNAFVRLLARVFNYEDLNFKIFVTTHSPYLLSSFNNLLEAGRVSEIKPEKAKQISKIVPEEEQLPPGLLTAYSISNGKMENLVDPETNLIKQTVLDNISNDIAIKFGKLLDIEF